MRSYQPGAMASGTRRNSVPASGNERPDPIRIAGISGTLLLNSGLFLLMLIPMARPDLRPDLREPEQTFRWITAPPVPPPPPPIEVQVVTPRASVPTTTARPVVTDPPAAVLVETGEPAAEVTSVLPEASQGPVDVASIAPPQSAAQLQYASAPPPPYPRAAMMAGDEGTVLLKVVVGIDGTPLSVSIHRSSGNRKLDDSARRHVLKSWRFQPASVDGVAVEAVGIVPIEFSLDRG